MTRSLGIRRSGLAAAATMLLLVVALFVQGAHADSTYLGAGTVVYKDYKDQDPTKVDHGVVVCHKATEIGIGGGCIPTPQGPPFAVNAIEVTDFIGQPDHAIAFQVCIDLNGDGLCVSQGIVPPDPTLDEIAALCTPSKPGDPQIDLVYFSHDDLWNFFNPLGPLPPGSTKCPPGLMKGPGFQGYIVFLCEGVHSPRDGAPHTHGATAGTIKGTTVPQTTGYGDFCGGLKDQVIKQYQVM